MVHKSERNRGDKWTLKDIVDRASGILDTFVKLGVAYTGYNATGHWTGALIGLVGLRMAESNNLAGGIAGVATLTALGLGNVAKGAPVPTEQTRIYITY